jgi:hypothetical protein
MDYWLTVNDKEDKPEQVRGNWLVMLRREGHGVEN